MPKIKCDEERIRELLGILLDNAMYYTPSGGEVSLKLTGSEEQLMSGGRSGLPGKAFGKTDSLDEKAAFCRITVSDNGPGIPDDKKEAVFHRFFRADISRADRSHFGLGLPIASEIASLHNGKLILEDAPGGGAVFTLVLPY